MNLALPVDYAPMEADSAHEIPQGPEWQYEPKWDGFRCLAFRDNDAIEIMSKAGQTLARYFPEIVDALSAVKAKRFVLDGELIVTAGKRLDFDALLQRIHPAVSRIKKLSRETPATLVVFDLLLDARGEDLSSRNLAERRKALEQFATTYLDQGPRIRLSPYSFDFDEAKRWFYEMAGALDGVIAKRRDVPYGPGTRHAVLKIKNLRTADCVVGGFRYGANGKTVGSLLLGLYDEEGLLNHVGFTSGLAAVTKAALTEKLEALIEPPGFTGAAPGGPSRWSTERSAEWKPLRPELVVEVQYDHFSGHRFRHGTKLLRWRPDKKPRDCTSKQVRMESLSPIDLLR